MRTRFAEGFEDASHAEFAAEGVAIGTNVADQQETLVGANDFDETWPVDAHGRVKK